jgi:hypothetical protein
MVARHGSVKFRITDAIHPRPEQILLELFGGRCLQGQVVAESDGLADERFVVLRVDGLSEPVVLRVEATTPARDASCLNEARRPLVTR